MHAAPQHFKSFDAAAQKKILRLQNQRFAFTFT